MTQTHFERMIQLANDVFANKSDPDQLDISEEVMERLHDIHPSTMSEYDDGNGPVAWILMIPTTEKLMSLFLEKKITEKELYDLTIPGEKYDSLYLCSAMVLEEFRRKGIAKRLILEAITEIQKDHQITSLFVWTFTVEGERGAEEISRLTGLPLYKRV